MTLQKRTVLERWDISPEELTEVIEEKPSLRGILLGYVAEVKLRGLFMSKNEITRITKHDDHDRRKKGDLIVTYKGHDFVIECKSLQTNSISKEGDRYWGKAQCDASDRRTIPLPDGSTVSTTNLLAGEFDVLAVNLFAFEEKWRFVFAKNGDLPRSRFRSYTPDQRQYLLATLVNVCWPPEPPFWANPFSLLDEMIQERIE